MKKLKQAISVFAICSFAVFATSCGANNEIKTNIKYLSSNDLAGRQAGTAENDKSAQFLADKLSEYGYVPFENDSMLVPFDATIPTSTKTELTINDEILNVGDHYIPPFGNNFEVFGTLSQEGNEIVALGSNNEQVALFIPSIKRLGWFPVTPGEQAQQIFMTDAGIEKVKAALGKTISYTCTSNIINKPLNNVIGVLPGADRTKALVVGAHFDHIGKVDGTDIVFNGAMDNATGIACALYVAKSLKSATPPVDIVFAFWNAEELSFQGSIAGAKNIESKYSSYGCINIDAFGIKNGEKTVLSTANGSQEACKLLEQKLISAGYKHIVSSNTYIPSDHQSFTSNISVCVSNTMEDMQPILHTNKDTIGMLNLNDISQFAEAFSDVIKKDSLVFADGSLQTKTNLAKKEFDALSMKEQENYINKIASTLKVDEFAVLANGMEVLSNKAKYFTNVQDIQKLYPQLEIAQKAGNFDIASIIVWDGLSLVSNDNLEVEKPYKRTFDIKNISAIDIIYLKDNQAVKYRVEMQTKDITMLEQLYGTKKIVQNRPNTFIYTQPDGYGKTVAMLGGEFIYIFTTGDVYYDENQFAGMLTKKLDDKSLYEIMDDFSVELITVKAEAN